MKPKLIFQNYNWIVLLVLFQNFIYSQEISSFPYSLSPGSQSETFKMPCTHTYQILLQENQVLSDGTNLPINPDYTAYIQTDTNQGILMINHENVIGSITRHTINFNTNSQLWNIGSSSYINFTDVVGTYRPCSGGLSPWGTYFAGEEHITTTDANNDGYFDAGWLLEINPYSGTLVDYGNDGLKDKCWALGQMRHENICFLSDSLTAYFGSDFTSTGFLFKFVANQKSDFSSGSLFVLKKSTLLALTGDWMPVPNSSIYERDSVINYAISIGATNFNRIEDVEIGPDGKVYFAATTNGRIYRLNDLGSTVDQSEIFVNNTTYTLMTESGPTSFTWGAGTDNLCFDNLGNLWALQDNAFGYILIVGPNHSASNPDIRIFGQSPLGSEPTGINFSPDYQYMFISFQHPTSTNSALITDASTSNYVFNKGTTLVVSRKEFLGTQIDAAFTTINENYCVSDTVISIETNAYSGNFYLDGNLTDSIHISQLSFGTHQISFNYLDSSNCPLILNMNFVLNNLPIFDITPQISYCYYDTSYQILTAPSGAFFYNSITDSNGFFNPTNSIAGDYLIYATYTDINGCSSYDTSTVSLFSPTYPSVPDLSATYCSNGTVDSINFLPIGTYAISDIGILTNTINPPEFALGTNYLTLIYTDSNSCVYDAIDSFNVFEPQSNFISDLPAMICQNASPIVIQGIPTGGVFQGLGIISDTLFPNSLSGGIQIMSYTTQDTNGCIFSSEDSYYIIFPSPIYAGEDKVICFGTESTELKGIPNGGFWQGPNISINGAVQTNTLTYGNYSYIYSHIDNNNCTNHDTLIISIQDCLNISENDFSEILIYPNPAISQIFIETTFIIKSIALYGTDGKRIANYQINEDTNKTSINVTNFEGGIYYLKITSDGGNEIISSIVVK